MINTLVNSLIGKRVRIFHISFSKFSPSNYIGTLSEFYPKDDMVLLKDVEASISGYCGNFKHKKVIINTKFIGSIHEL